MRTAFRFLAPRLQPFTPTGIAGILTHPHPRPVLIGVYNETLKHLSDIPEHSVYRQAVENLTKQRLEIVESVKPFGYDEFFAKIGPVPFEKVATYIRDICVTEKAFYPDNLNTWGVRFYIDELEKNFEGIADYTLKGLSAEETKKKLHTEFEVVERGREDSRGRVKGYRLIMEPQWTAEQVEEVEGKIMDGLIEEVTAQAWKELKLVKYMKEDKCWEPLAEPAPEGQWVGFERTEKSG